MIQTTSPATIGRQSGSECTRKEGRRCDADHRHYSGQLIREMST